MRVSQGPVQTQGAQGAQHGSPEGSGIEVGRSASWNSASCPRCRPRGGGSSLQPAWQEQHQLRDSCNPPHTLFKITAPWRGVKLVGTCVWWGLWMGTEDDG